MFKKNEIKKVRIKLIKNCFAKGFDPIMER